MFSSRVSIPSVSVLTKKVLHRDKASMVVGLIVILLSVCTGANAADNSKAVAEDEVIAGDVKAVVKKKAEPAKSLNYIAIVGDEKIMMVDYISALRKGIREKFYHGKTPEAEMKKFRKEVAEKLVSRLLFIQEAKRRGITPDLEAVNETMKAFDAKYKDNPDWAKARDKVFAQLKIKLQGDSLADLLEKQVRVGPVPNDGQLSAYYDKNNALFTTPEKVRVSLILLKVAPSSGGPVWQQAGEEANAILGRITSGSDFADMARIHSSDNSAQNGGDMGYTHSGMLGDIAQKVLSLMEPGEVSSPVILLEGVALFRLEDRVKPILNPLESVKERALKLFQRDSGEQAWKDLDIQLQKKTKIEYNDAPWR